MGMEKSSAAANLSVDKVRLDRIVLVPGFCEPRWLLWPLKTALSDCADCVEIWHDDLVHRKLERSIDKLHDAFAIWNRDHQRVAVVTHSFGDWITRQALARSQQHPVHAIASIAPIIAASPIAKVIRCLGGNWISEVPVMANRERASEFATVSPEVRRLIIWGAADPWVRPYPFAESVNQKVEHVYATHITVVLQPAIHRSVRRFLVHDN